MDRLTLMHDPLLKHHGSEDPMLFLMLSWLVVPLHYVCLRAYVYTKWNALFYFLFICLFVCFDVAQALV